MHHPLFKLSLLLLVQLVFSLFVTAQFIQQGNKLTGTGNTGNSSQGGAVAISGDGNTAIVGGPGDNARAGAAWIYTRSGGLWTQQGDKLVGTGAVARGASQGRSVSLSSDGKTALVGGTIDSAGIGAVWVFTTPPTIQSFTPTSTCINTVTSVKISGTNFTGVTDVSFGGTAAASFTVVDDTTILAVVGNGSSGDVAVTSNLGTATLAGFTFYTTLPTVGINASPSTLVCQGTAVTLTGTGADSYTWTNGITNAVSFIPVDTDSIFSSRTDVETADRNCNSNECRSAPERIAAGDIDGDGKKDLVVTDYIADSIFVFKNISRPGRLDSTAFAQRVGFRCGRSPWPSTILPYDVAIDDMDGDGKNDILVTNSNDTSISVFRNISSAGVLDASSLAPKIELTTGITPLGIETADIDGDGKKDIIVASLSNNADPGTPVFFISVFKNISTAGSITSNSFAARVDFASNYFPKDIAVADIDADGKPDIVVTNYNGNPFTGGNTISVFRNNSTTGIINAASFQPKLDFETGPSPSAIAVDDLDGDGKKDIAVTCGDNTLSVFRNESIPGMIGQNSLSPKIDIATGEFPWHLSIADMNGDGRNDMIVTNAAGNTFTYFRNTILTPGSISSHSFAGSIFSTADNPRGTVIADLDGDGRKDLAIANNADTSISIFGNDGLRYTVTGTNANGCVDTAVIMLTVIECFPVPLRFISVSGNRKGTNVQIDWIVAEENKVNRYVIERSINGIDFLPVGTINSADHRMAEKSYSFTDRSAPGGIVFYRVKCETITGSNIYSSIVKVHAGINQAGYNVIPNPVKDGILNLQFLNQPAGKYSIRIVSYSGQIITAKMIDHRGGNALQTVLLPATIARGMYSVEISTMNQPVYRISIQK